MTDNVTPLPVVRVERHEALTPAAMLDTIQRIYKLVHVPTSQTPHKRAGDHFAADFEAIRKMCRPFCITAEDQR
ncbi:hypothetical protein [Rhodopseudomonas sp. B29]|uniref:hypothetical protein n=1 Tax=Rhodopseudomonas sp. B29 TaxID=95607 RepID=UPI0003B2FC96|nr:hypothetical protein [Rhodopseudomonas sp. B29]